VSDLTRYALYCKNCGHVEDKAWKPATASEHSERTQAPLTPKSHAPIYCQKCGVRNWEQPATKKHLEEYDSRIQREARALELCASDDFEGMLKIPDEIKGSPEIKRALSNMLGPLEGDVLKAAQSNVLKIARQGIQGADALTWIDYYDRAVQMAIKGSGAKGKASV
jgi:hypothetical protein